MTSIFDTPSNEHYMSVPCQAWSIKDSKIASMAEELENMYQIFDEMSVQLDQKMFQLFKNKIEQKQEAIKIDLETSHLKVKTKLLQETLENKNKDLLSLESFKHNNEQLLSLLERYDQKVVEMQTEIDIRDLRIKDFEERGGSQRTVSLGKSHRNSTVVFNSKLFTFGFLKCIFNLTMHR